MSTVVFDEFIDYSKRYKLGQLTKANILALSFLGKKLYITRKVCNH